MNRHILLHVQTHTHTHTHVSTDVRIRECAYLYSWISLFTTHWNKDTMINRAYISLSKTPCLFTLRPWIQDISLISVIILSPILSGPNVLDWRLLGILVVYWDKYNVCIEVYTSNGVGGLTYRSCLHLFLHDESCPHSGLRLLSRLNTLLQKSNDGFAKFEWTRCIRECGCTCSWLANGLDWP